LWANTVDAQNSPTGVLRIYGRPNDDLSLYPAADGGLGASELWGVILPCISRATLAQVVAIFYQKVEEEMRGQLLALDTNLAFFVRY
jgi:hypothetical protein